MATLKEVKSKIVSVKKTRQITSAMKMVATSRLRGAQSSMEAFKPYAGKFAEVLGSVAGKAGEAASPLLVSRDPVQKVAVILCTSDRGLCGGFNVNLTTKTRRLIESELEGKDIFMTCFGKRGRDWARKKSLGIEDEFIGVMGGRIEFSLASSSGQKFINSFLEGAVDEVYLVYSEFQSMARQVPTVKKILPIPPIEEIAEDQPASGDGQQLVEHLCEPSSEELLGKMLPRNVFIQIYDALLQTSTSEHASRMRAMENATKACEDMVSELQTIYNKTRQSDITAELMDIVGGAEALNG